MGFCSLSSNELPKENKQWPLDHDENSCKQWITMSCLAMMSSAVENKNPRICFKPTEEALEPTFKTELPECVRLRA